MTSVSSQAQAPLGRQFQLLWASTGVSNIADGIGMVALPLLAAQITRDPALIAGIAAAQRLPWLLFTLISGVLVDRLDRRVLQRTTNLARALIFALLGAMLFFNIASLPLLFLAAFLLGIAETFFDNAAFALLPAVVVRNQLERANGRIYTTQTVANEFIGPPVGGGLFAIFGAAPLLLNALVYGFSALLVHQLRGSFRAVAATGSTQVSLRHEIAEGLRWFLHHKLLHALGIKAAFEHGCWAATMALLVLVVQERMELDATAYGILLAAGASGGVIGGLVASRMIARIGAGGAAMLNLVLQAGAYFGIALSTDPVVIALMLAIMSFTGSIGGVVGSSFRQAIIPAQLMGRVTSAFRLYALGAMALGALLGGLLARTCGLLAPYWLSGVLLLVLFVALLPIVNNRTMAAARDEQAM